MQSIKNWGSSLASGIGYVYNEVYTIGAEAGAEFANMYRDVTANTAEIYTDISTSSWVATSEPDIKAIEKSRETETEITPIASIKNIKDIREQEKKAAEAAVSMAATNASEKPKIHVFSVDSFPKSPVAGLPSDIATNKMKTTKLPAEQQLLSDKTQTLISKTQTETFSEVELKSKEDTASINDTNL